MNDPDDLVAIYHSGNVTEAHFVKNLLVDEGIEARVSGEHAQFNIAMTPSEVLVHRRDEARARGIVELYDAEQERRAARPDWICPACHATMIGAFDECDACGAVRPGSEEA